VAASDLDVMLCLMNVGHKYIVTLYIFKFSLNLYILVWMSPVCAIRKVQENQVGLKLDATHQLLGCADDVRPLEYNIYTVKKNIEAFN
jgi:hypothetical protein